MPGAFSAAPGGICERRSTFEWDNENRAALINVDDLSVDLSEDSDDDEEMDEESEVDPYVIVWEGWAAFIC